MLSLLRRPSVLKRFSTEYVIAQRIDGKLVEAQFDRSSKDFCYNPRLTASIKLTDTYGLCTIGGVYKVVEEKQIGNIKNIQYPKDKRWYGFIGPIDAKDSNIIFGLVRAIWQIVKLFFYEILL